MEEARGEEELGGLDRGGGQKGGCGTWDGEDEANNGKKKNKKNLHFNLEAFFGGLHMRFLSLSPLPSSDPAAFFHSFTRFVTRCLEVAAFIYDHWCCCYIFFPLHVIFASLCLGCVPK